MNMIYALVRLNCIVVEVKMTTPMITHSFINELHHHQATMLLVLNYRPLR